MRAPLDKKLREVQGGRSPISRAIRRLVETPHAMARESLRRDLVAMIRKKGDLDDDEMHDLADYLRGGGRKRGRPVDNWATRYGFGTELEESLSRQIKVAEHCTLDEAVRLYIERSGDEHADYKLILKRLRRGR